MLFDSRLKDVPDNVSFAPSALCRFPLLPTASAVGFILPPLCGWGWFTQADEATVGGRIGDLAIEHPSNLRQSNPRLPLVMSEPARSW